MQIDIDFYGENLTVIGIRQWDGNGDEDWDYFEFKHVMYKSVEITNLMAMLDHLEEIGTVAMDKLKEDTEG